MQIDIVRLCKQQRVIYGLSLIIFPGRSIKIGQIRLQADIVRSKLGVDHDKSILIGSRVRP